MRRLRFPARSGTVASLRLTGHVRLAVVLPPSSSCPCVGFSRGLRRHCTIEGTKVNPTKMERRMDGKEIEESAKAVQELAKLGGKTLDTANAFGRLVKGPIETVVGIIDDRLRFTRAERRLRMAAQLSERVREVSGDGPVRRIPLNFAVDVLEAGAFEDDDRLQDMWAQLLANATTATDEEPPRASHVNILKDLTPLDARVMDAIYSIPFESARHQAIKATGLPAEVDIMRTETDRDAEDPPGPIMRSLANLIRLGLIGTPSTWGGGQLLTHVYQTYSGWDFVQSVRRAPPGSAVESAG